MYSPLYILVNSRFVYALVRNALKFQKLADFNLDAALSEKSSNIARKHATDDEAGLSEKAKGKLPEGSTLTRHSSSSSQLQSNNVSFPGIKNGFIPTENWVRKGIVYPRSIVNKRLCTGQ